MSEHTHYYKSRGKYYTYKQVTCSVCGKFGAEEGKFDMLGSLPAVLKEYVIEKNNGSTPIGIRSVQWKDDFYYLAQLCNNCMGDIYVDKKGFTL